MCVNVCVCVCVCANVSVCRTKRTVVRLGRWRRFTHDIATDVASTREKEGETLSMTQGDKVGIARDRTSWKRDLWKDDRRICDVNC